MAIKTCAQIFAERGDQWNARNEQHNAAPILRTIERHGRIVGHELDWEVEGYVPVASGPRAAIHKTLPYEPGRKLDPRLRLEVNKVRRGKPWNPEYRPVRPVAQVQIDSQPLDEVQLTIRKRQRAAEKARHTRCRNQAQAQEAERLAEIDDLMRRF
jgi:hypothetical protein